ncbi:MAG: ABC transporter substrate-binding protein [Ancalomicrobiaceae bacterium]|nr:ABC transporter substrate-binding protein [Ancalomicrobiaceae bacterium]
MKYKATRTTLAPLVVAAGIIAMPMGASAADEIKIGMLSAFTGTFASFGQLQKEGAVMALEEWNYKVAGKTIKVIYADDQLDNELAVTKAKQLVEQDKVDVVTGLVSGDEGLSVASYMKGKDIPIVPMYSASEDSTMRKWYPFVVRPTWTGAQPMDVFGYWLSKVKGLKKIYMIGEDYSYPYNQAGGFKRGFLRGGGVEVTTVWHPVPTSDYSSIISSIPLDKKYDAVLYNGAGSDAVAFVKQYVEFGMQSKIPLLGQSNTFEKPDLDSMPQQIVGAYSAHLTADDMNTPNWNKFRDAFQKRWQHSPSAASEFAYGSMELILRAIKARNGDVTDKAALAAAMHKVDLSDEPRGPVALDEYNAAIENVYIREVAVGSDGVMYNKGLFTAKNVNQFGPYDSKIYMKQPSDGPSSPPDLRADMPREMLEVAKDYEFVPFGK